MYNKIWNESMIKEHIIARIGREDLNYYYYSETYPDVHAAAIRIFGSWRNAIESCEIDYSTVRKYKRWSKKIVVSEIQKLAEQGEKLNSATIQKNNKPLYMAAIKRFNSWGNALNYAGIDYNAVAVNKNFNKKDLFKIVTSLRKQGVSLAYPNMRKNYQNILATATRKLGEGSWQKARKSCGINENYHSMEVKKKNNFSELHRTGVLHQFVREHDGQWEHEQWLSLINKISKQFSPIDINKVGLALEQLKSMYSEN